MMDRVVTKSDEAIHLHRLGRDHSCGYDLASAQAWRISVAVSSDSDRWVPSCSQISEIGLLPGAWEFLEDMDDVSKRVAVERGLRTHREQRARETCRHHECYGRWGV